jgi:SH3-like domain-containing protein
MRRAWATFVAIIRAIIAPRRLAITASVIRIKAEIALKEEQSHNARVLGDLNKDVAYWHREADERLKDLEAERTARQRCEIELAHAKLEVDLSAVKINKYRHWDASETAAQLLKTGKVTNDDAIRTLLDAAKGDD